MFIPKLSSQGDSEKFEKKKHKKKHQTFPNETVKLSNYFEFVTVTMMSIIFCLFY